ncbi:MAG: redox-sensing transcriptional repressor Rex [Chloroflexi bacterium 44-23]|nr:MAG: redox-sensing transcriptional repressor Rex [Chloroflexi bacterium 44-23]
MQNKQIPDIVVGRLPSYLQMLKRLKTAGETNTSSKELGLKLEISAAQIRKDLSHFGEFGKQGTGYSINYLIECLEDILHVNKVWDMALVGVGFLGHAIANFQGFNHHGFQIKCIFDVDPSKIGQFVAGHIILDISELEKVIRKLNIQVAMITVDADNAQDVADKLVRAGIKSILNYAPVIIKVPSGIQIQYINPIIKLQHMTYYLK